MFWNPTQYLKYSSLRERPAIELMERIPFQGIGNIVDLGCGAGNVTRLLKQRWPKAHITGIDSSEAMLQSARQISADIEWEQANIQTWASKTKLDLIYSNATLHWLDQHAKLFPSLLSHLKSRGILAVQISHNFDEPSHAKLYALAQAACWKDKLGELVKLKPTKDPMFYCQLLLPLVHSLDIWESTYYHILEGADAILDFMKGSWLAPFLAKLTEEEQQEFTAAYAKQLQAAYPPTFQEKTIYPFRRLFMVAESL